MEICKNEWTYHKDAWFDFDGVEFCVCTKGLHLFIKEVCTNWNAYMGTTESKPVNDTKQKPKVG